MPLPSFNKLGLKAPPISLLTERREDILGLGRGSVLSFKPQPFVTGGITQPTYAQPIQQAFRTKRIEEPIRDFFRPTLDVRKRDILREIPGAIVKIGKFTGEVGRVIARNVASAGMTVAGAIAPKELKPFVRESLRIENVEGFFTQSLIETIFGKEPIKSIEQRIAEAEPKVKEWGEELEKVADTPGLTSTQKTVTQILSYWAKNNPELLAFAGVFGMVGIDLTPYGGLQKGALKAIVRAKTLGKARSVLSKMGIADDLVKTFAPDVVKVTDEKSAKALFNSIANLQQKTKVVPVAKAIPKEFEAIRKGPLPIEPVKPKIEPVPVAKVPGVLERLVPRIKKPPPTKRAIEEVVGLKGRPRKIVKAEDVLLRKRIRDEARGARVAKKVTTKELTTLFKASRTELRQIREELLSYVKDSLPASARGKFITNIVRTTTRKRMASIWSRVEREKIDIARRELTSELKELRLPKGSIAVSYQKKITETMADIDLVKPTEKTLNKLRGLRDYIEREGVPLGIQQKHIDNLNRLTKKNVSQMSVAELEELKGTVDHLNRLGKVKQQLKYKYIERERKLALDRLIESTRSLDPKIPPEGVRFREQRLAFAQRKADVTRVYMDTLHTPRVADMIDGFKGYQGENARHIKKLWRAELDAKTTSQQMTMDAMQEIKDIGIKDIDEKMMQRIMVNIRNRESAYEQVRTLLDHYGMGEEVPKLTWQEEKVIDVIKKYTNKYTDDIAAVYEEIENVPFRKLDEYILPIKYEKEFNLVPSKTIEQGRYRTAQTFKGFTYTRQKGVDRLPRTDLFGILEEALGEQQWYLRLQPELENIKYLIGDDTYKQAAGELATNFWKDHLDIVSRRGWSATAQASPLLRGARINLTKAILGYKVSSTMMQPFAVFDGMAYAQARYGTGAALEILWEFSKTWINPKYASRIIAESKALPMRRAGELSIEELLRETKGRGLLKKFQRGGLLALQEFDVRTAAGVEKGFHDILKANNIPNAKEEAEFLMNMVSSSADVTLRPHILARGEGARTWFTFQTFFLNRWGVQIHDIIISGLIKGKGMRKKLAALIGLGIFTAGAIAENEARLWLWEKITGKEMKRPSGVVVDALMSVPENIPYFGNIIEGTRRGWGGGEPPIMRVIENVAFGGKQLLTGEGERRVKGGIKVFEGLISLIFGIPGTAQLADIAERFLAPPKTKVIPTKGLPSFNKGRTEMPSFKTRGMELPSFAK